MPNLALSYRLDYPNNVVHPRNHPLHAAIMAQDLNAVHYALMTDIHAVNYRTTNGMTALHFAVLIGDFLIVEELIREGANPRERDDIGDTPLHIAARTGNLLIARRLLEQFANPNAQDDELRTPLHWAAWINNLKMVQMLIAYGADPTLMTRAGRYARDFARKQNIRNLLEAFM
jgi:ankyrin repeat protein